jgi:hypothetical protein
MASQPYVDGITDTVPHGLASSLTASQIRITAGDTLRVLVVCPDRSPSSCRAAEHASYPPGAAPAARASTGVL